MLYKIFYKLKRLIFLIYDYYKFWRISFLPKNKKFQYIYKSKYWQNIENGSLSGSGSNIISTEKIRIELKDFISKYKISSIIDIPCGDWEWMSMFDLSNIEYVGYDVVQELITLNNKKYKSKNINFAVKNLIYDSLPKTDFIIIRDMLNHLDESDIHKCIKNLQNSEFQFIGITNFPDINDNITNILGDKFRLGDRWRPINFSIKPFNLNHPLINLNDSCDLTETDKMKYLSIWKKDSFIFNNK